MATHQTVPQGQRRPLLDTPNAERVRMFAEMSNRDLSKAANVLVQRGWESVTVQREAEVMPRAPGVDRKAPHTTASYHLPLALVQAVKALAESDRRTASGTVAMLVAEALAARAAQAKAPAS
jgi:hypothetical protein